MKIIQYIPNFVSIGDERLEAEFTTVEELLAVKFVNNFSTSKGFIGYRLSEDQESLVAEYMYDRGYESWVVGHLEGVDKDFKLD
jgi:hypothetical protein